MMMKLALFGIAMTSIVCIYEQKVYVSQKVQKEGIYAGDLLHIEWDRTEMKEIDIKLVNKNNKKYSVGALTAGDLTSGDIILPAVSEGMYTVMFETKEKKKDKPELYEVSDSTAFEIKNDGMYIERVMRSEAILEERASKVITDPKEHIIRILTPVCGQCFVKGKMYEMLWEYQKKFDFSHVNIQLLKRENGRFILVEQLIQAPSTQTSFVWSPSADLESTADYHIYIGASGNPQREFTRGGQSNAWGTLGTAFYLRTEAEHEEYLRRLPCSGPCSCSPSKKGKKCCKSDKKCSSEREYSCSSESRDYSACHKKKCRNKQRRMHHSWKEAEKESAKETLGDKINSMKNKITKKKDEVADKIADKSSEKKSAGTKPLLGLGIVAIISLGLL